MKLNLGSGRYPLDGFENLNEPGTPWSAGAIPWRAEDGLPYPDGSVEAVTVSHLLMYLDRDAWPALFAEIARVLEPGGVVRVTEDEMVSTASARQGLQPGARSQTDVYGVTGQLALAGLAPYWRTPTSTVYRDASLIQTHHGDPPDVFHVEGHKAR